MTMLPHIPRRHQRRHAHRRWLEGGLVASYEKYVIDVQMLESLQKEFTPVNFTEEELAFGATKKSVPVALPRC